MIFTVVLECPGFAVATAAISDTVIRSQVLYRAWHDRRDHQWATSAIHPGGVAAKTPHQASAEITLPALSKAGNDVSASAQVAIAVHALDSVQALETARIMLDLAIPSEPLRYAPASRGFMTQSSVGQCRRGDAEVIGSVPEGFVEGRYLSELSTHLGSYGAGGVGWLGFKLNEGSWMVVPVNSAASWTWLTTETVSVDAARTRMEVDIDRRIIGCHPDQLADFHPWDHRYASTSPTIEDLPDFKNVRPRIVRFDRSPTSFLLEAENGGTTYRFEVANHLSRPPYAGSGEERLFQPDDDLGASLFLAHSPYVCC